LYQTRIVSKKVYVLIWPFLEIKSLNILEDFPMNTRHPSSSRGYKTARGQSL